MGAGLRPSLAAVAKRSISLGSKRLVTVSGYKRALSKRHAVVTSRVLRGRRFFTGPEENMKNTRYGHIIRRNLSGSYRLNSWVVTQIMNEPFPSDSYRMLLQ